MNFLYPQFLYGFFALIIPIIIHLFNFRKAKKLYFSSNHFLKNLQKKSSSRLKLKHLLILAARLLFIAFLVLAFAQPYSPSENHIAGNEDVYIYLDNSMSMTNTTSDNLTAFETGIQFMNKISDSYPAGVRFKLLTNDFAPYSNHLKSRDELKEIMTEIGISGVSRSFGEIHQRLDFGSIVESGSNDVYWISDFQKSTAGTIPTMEEDTTSTLYLVPIRSDRLANVYVDSLYLENPFILPNEKNELKVTFGNDGTREVDDLMVKLFINDMQSANASISIAGNSKATVTFPLNFGLEKVNHCRISFEDYPVTFDNDFYFTINMIDKIRILEVRGENISSQAVARVFGNQDLFISESYPASNLEYNLIENADLVVLNELQSIQISLADALRDFVAEGGHILIIPSATPDIESYKQISSVINFERIEDAELKSLQSPDLKNPFFWNIFEETSERFDMPNARNSVKWRNSSGNLLSYANGRPYLSVFTSTGNIYTLGGPLNDNYTSLHRHALFLPLMYRMGALSKNINERLYFSLDEQTLAIEMDTLYNNAIYKLMRHGDQEEIIPSQMITGKKLVLEMPKYILNSGFYSLTLNSEITKTLALNLDKEESLLEQYNDEELKNAFSTFKNIRVFEISNLNEFDEQMEANFLGTPFWRILLVIALLFLLCEILLIRFL